MYYVFFFVFFITSIKNSVAVPGANLLSSHGHILHFRAFSRCFCPKWLTVIHTFTHWWRWPTSTPGAVWGSVSCQRTLWHAHQGNWTSSLLMTRHWPRSYNSITNKTISTSHPLLFMAYVARILSTISWTPLSKNETHGYPLKKGNDRVDLCRSVKDVGRREREDGVRPHGAAKLV